MRKFALGFAALSVIATSIILAVAPANADSIADLSAPTGGHSMPACQNTAHRGGTHWTDATENSLGAYRRSFYAGACAVEVDLRTTKDSYPIAMHDLTLDRTTTGTGVAHLKTIAQVRARKLNDGTTVPTASELMAQVKRNGRTAVLEIKGAWSARAYDRLAASLAKYGVNRFTIEGKSWVQLAAIKKRVPSVKTAFVTWHPELVTDARLASVSGLIVPAKVVDDRLIARADAKNKKLWSFFSDYDPENLETPDGWERLTGRTGIITEDPTAYAAWL